MVVIVKRKVQFCCYMKKNVKENSHIFETSNVLQLWRMNTTLHAGARSRYLENDATVQSQLFHVDKIGRFSIPKNVESFRFNRELEDALRATKISRFFSGRKIFFSCFTHKKILNLNIFVNQHQRGKNIRFTFDQS